jgi:hypothetical protein
MPIKALHNVKHAPDMLDGEWNLLINGKGLGALNSVLDLWFKISVTSMFFLSDKS